MKRDHLYTVRKNLLIWPASISLVASAVSAAALQAPYYGWWIGAITLYLLILLLSGDEMLYRTAVPVWGLCILCALGSASVFAWIGGILFAAGYTAIISGRISKFWLIPLCLAALGGTVYGGRRPEMQAALGLLLLYPAIKVHTDGKWHPTWGDRIDGRRVRTAQVMEQITAFFMPDRTGANNLFSESVEITELERYIRRKRREGMPGFGITHAVLAAYVRTVAK